MLGAQIAQCPIERHPVLSARRAREHRYDARGDVGGGWIEQRAVICKRDLVEVVPRVVDVERREPAVLALHAHEPIERPTDCRGVAFSLRSRVHEPRHDGGVVEIRIGVVAKLKSPTTSWQPGPLRPPVAGTVEAIGAVDQLQARQPLQRCRQRCKTPRTALLFERQASECGIPHR